MTTSPIPRVQVFDPAMCCPTGVCGPSVDPALVRFSADLDFLKGQGLVIERFNLAQQPAAFVEHAVVREALHANPDCLPLIVVDGRIVAQGSYPATRDQLASLVGLPAVAQGCCAEAPGETASGCCAEAPGETASGCCADQAADAACCDEQAGCCDADAACCDDQAACCDADAACCDDQAGCCDADAACCEPQEGCCEPARGCC